MKKILFLTGTRADFGKMKPLMLPVEQNDHFECHVFITGMHTLQRYGKTEKEVINSGFKNTHTYMNQHIGDRMEMILASTVKGLSRYVNELKPDLLVIHGDRVEALAGAIVGALTNTLVCHIEGGERSGTIDESIRHSVSKLSHIHMVCNQEAVDRLIQMGEARSSIYNIGSPDIDVMCSPGLPSISEVKSHYDIPFKDFGVVMFHPVTTEIDKIGSYAKDFVSALIDSKKNYVVIYPNNDEGTDKIFSAYQVLEGNERFKVFPSVKFEYFLTMLKNSSFLIGNSSAGIREMPFYGLPSINIGTRQNERYFSKSIINTGYSYEEVKAAIKIAGARKKMNSDGYFGDGKSADRFVEIIKSKSFWITGCQKEFYDLGYRGVA